MKRIAAPMLAEGDLGHSRTAHLPGNLRPLEKRGLKRQGEEGNPSSTPPGLIPSASPSVGHDHTERPLEQLAEIELSTGPAVDSR